MKRITDVILPVALLCTSTTTFSATYYNCAQSGCVKVENNQKAESNYAATIYPVLLQHGYAASNKGNTFYQIPSDMAAVGAQVYFTRTPAYASSYVRGEYLANQVKAIQALTNAPKVHIFGHSQGASDARFVAGTDPEAVASVTAISSPARGSAVADFMLSFQNTGDKHGFDPSFISKAIIGLLNLFGKPAKDDPDAIEPDAEASLTSLSTAGAHAFTTMFPMGMSNQPCGQDISTSLADNGVHYFSWVGRSQFTNMFDPQDYSYLIFNLMFKGQTNDGLTTPCSSEVGRVISQHYALNHTDVVNETMGLRGWFTPDPKSLFKQQANRLKNMGM